MHAAHAATAHRAGAYLTACPRAPDSSTHRLHLQHACDWTSWPVFTFPQRSATQWSAGKLGFGTMQPLSWVPCRCGPSTQSLAKAHIQRATSRSGNSKQRGQGLQRVVPEHSQQKAVLQVLLAQTTWSQPLIFSHAAPHCAACMQASNAGVASSERPWQPCSQLSPSLCALHDTHSPALAQQRQNSIHTGLTPWPSSWQDSLGGTPASPSLPWGRA